MKKMLYFIFVVLFALVLVGCTPSDEAKLQEYLSKITVQTEAQENFYLPSSIDGLTDHSISWESSNKEVIRIGNLASVNGVNYYTANVTRAEEDKEVELTATVELVSGLSSQKSFRVKVIKAEKVEVNYITVAEALASKLNASVVVKGVVSGFHYGTYNNEPSTQGCYLTDETGTIYVYGYILAQSVEKGDEIIIDAVVGQYNTYKQLSNPTLVEKLGTGKQISTVGAITDKTVADIVADLSSDYTGKAFIFEEVQIKKIQGTDYINYVLEDKGGNSINLYSSGNSSEFAWLDQYAGTELKVLFAINSQNSKGTKWRGHVLDVLEVVEGSNGGNTSTDAKKATVSEILGLAASLADKDKLEGKYETTGTVTTINTAYDASYGNVTFTITDGSQEILCYRPYGDLAANVAVGKTVTVVGEVQNYSGTIEFVYADVIAIEGENNNPGDEIPEPGTMVSVKEAIACAVNATVKVQGIVSGFHYGTYNSAPSIQGCYITDATGTMYVYGYQVAQSVAKGDEIIIEAVVAEYNTYKQLSTPTLVQKVSSGNQTPITGAVTNKTVAQIAGDLSTNYTATAYIFEGVQIVKVDGGSYINYVMEDLAGNAINVYSSGDSSEFAWLDKYAGKELKVLFAINSQNSKGTKWRGHVLDVLEVVGDWTGENNNQGGNNNPGGSNTPEVSSEFVKEIQTGVAYKFVIDQTSLGQKYFFTGAMNGYYGATSTDASDAVNVYLEAVNGGYNLYFMNGSVKQYIVIVVSGTHYNFTIASEASTVWVFDTTYYTLTTTVDSVVIYMGTYGSYNTFGGSDYDKHISSSFPARFYPENTTGGSVGGNENQGGENDTIIGEVAATIYFNDLANRTAYSTEKQVWEQNGVKVTNNKAASTSNVGDYSNPGRFYKSSDLTIEYSEAMTKIVIYTPGGKYIYSSTDTIAGATLVIDGNKMVITLDTPATSFTITKLAIQVRASQIDIYTE